MTTCVLVKPDRERLQFKIMLRFCLFNPPPETIGMGFAYFRAVALTFERAGI